MSNSSELFGGGSPPKKWVTGTTYQEGALVWSPSDYQYFMRKSTGAGVTDPSSDLALWQPTGDRAVKSIQRGSISLGAITTGTATITSVNTSKTELRYLGCKSNSANSDGLAYIELTNSTTITATKVSASSTSSVVTWELTERF